MGLRMAQPQTAEVWAKLHILRIRSKKSMSQLSYFVFLFSARDYCVREENQGSFVFTPLSSWIARWNLEAYSLNVFIWKDRSLSETLSTTFLYKKKMHERFTLRRRKSNTHQSFLPNIALNKCRTCQQLILPWSITHKHLPRVRYTYIPTYKSRCSVPYSCTRNPYLVLY